MSGIALNKFIGVTTMNIKLIRASVNDAKLIWKMQVKSFAALYERYQDHDTSPATEPIEKITARLEQPFTYYYLIKCGEDTVGAIRIVDMKDGVTRKRVSPIFILPKFRNKGFAQAAMLAAEDIHGREHWELDTILQEKGNCYLYEKMGYTQTGEQTDINEHMTLVFYIKD